MPKGLAIIIGGKAKPKEEEASEEADSSEAEYAGMAFDALKDDDREGFVEAFIGAVKACMKSYGEE